MKRENIQKAIKIEERIRIIEKNIDSWQKCTKFYNDTVQITDTGTSCHSVRTATINFSVMKILVLSDLEQMLQEANNELKQLD